MYSNLFKLNGINSLIIIYHIIYLIPGLNGVSYWRKLGPLPSEMKLGAGCKSSIQCLHFIAHSHCDWESRQCTCQPYHIESENKTICYPASLLTYGCSIEKQCTLKVPNSECRDGTCQCSQNFIPYRKDKCLPPAGVDEYCLNEKQCKLSGKYTYCKYIIPRVYGKCKCPLGYTMSADKECLPNLGSACEATQDCEKLTKNSFCPRANKRQLSSSKSTRTCACKKGFRASRDLKSCDAEKPVGLTTAASMTFLKNKTEILPVSLGMKCQTSIECRVRDPYATCVNGICECMEKTSSCSSINRGCYNDTFQCRNGKCISWYFVCDKRDQCGDNSDEDVCRKFKCPKEAFQCNDGTCLPRASVCNGHWECPDGSDEAQCYRGIKCHPKSFQCKSGQCLPQHTFCNALSDCLDGTDELESVCEKADNCPKGTHQCKNNKCRSTAILCSGQDGCGDNSDEDQCEVCYCKPPSST